jgi:DNA polymerase-3 subunit delta'
MHPWNQPILEALQRRSARLPHALLIYGARGLGKLALAEGIAQFLLCESSAAPRPCGACAGCRWFAAGNHPDFRRVEPEVLAPAAEAAEEGAEPPARRGKPSTEIKVEQVRALAAFLNLGSHRGRSRVALVHPAEEMNAVAANALLKGLEEPPAGAMFVLVSHRPARLLPTVRSRCVALPVPIPALETAQAWLDAQGVKDAERWLAYAGGAPLRALEYAGDARALEGVLKAPGPADEREALDRLAEALQKIALDRALMAAGLVPKYQTGGVRPHRRQLRAWLAFARQMGRSRALARHPLNPKLLSAEMLAMMPKD